MLRPLLAVAVLLLLFPAVAAAHGGCYGEYRGPPPGWGDLRGSPSSLSAPLPPPPPGQSAAGKRPDRPWLRVLDADDPAVRRTRPPAARSRAAAAAVLPEIVALLDSKLAPGARARVALAIAAFAAPDRPLPDWILRRLADRLADAKENRGVRAASAVALGASAGASPVGRDRLLEALADESNPDRVRAAAALALGLLARTGWLDPGIAGALRSAANEGGDVGACALLAMGLSARAAFRTDVEAVLAPATVPDEPGRGLRLEPFALVALGHIAPVDFPVLETLSRGLRSGRAAEERAAAAACARIGTATDAAPDLRRAIVIRLARELPFLEGAAAEAARLALGRIGAAADTEIRTRVVAILAHDLTVGAEEGRDAAAIALGLVAGREDLDAGERIGLAGLLLARLREAPADTPAADAARLALGLAGDPGAARTIRGTPPDAWSTLALALLDARPYVCFLPTGDDPGGESLRLPRTAAAAALAGETGCVPILAWGLNDPEVGTLGRLRRIEALGRLGDEVAVPTLYRTLVSEEAPDALRGAAAVALADLFDGESPLVGARILRDLPEGSGSGTVAFLLALR